MTTEIRIYYEGDRQLGDGFLELFSVLRDRARQRRCRFRLISAKGTPCQDFDDGITSHPRAWNILLKDSEKPWTDKLAVALCEENGWDASRAGSIFWMVEMMESWFHADRAALKEFYGRGFNESALKSNPTVERIPKKDLISGLRAATRRTSKGEYHKTMHAPQLLAAIDPALVRKAAPNCNRLFEAVLNRLSRSS